MATAGTQTVTIHYASPGARPPVFVAGSFTAPPWQPIELDYKVSEQDFEFSRDFDIAEGQWQYKFRLGFGDWWVCDENAEIGTDGAGNRNNIVRVQSQRQAQIHQDKYVHCKPLHDVQDPHQDRAWDTVELEPSHKESSHAPAPAPKDGHMEYCHITGRVNASSNNAVVRDDEKHRMKLPHSTSQSRLTNTVEQDLNENEDHSFRIPSIPISPGSSKNLASPPIILEEDEMDQEPSYEQDNRSYVNVGNVQPPSLGLDLTGQLVVPTEETGCVLLPPGHDTLPSTPPIIVHAPLFPHECQTSHDFGHGHYHNKIASIKDSPELPIIDPMNDPFLEVFPTEPEQMLRRIATTGNEMSEDVTLDSGVPSPFQTIDPEMRHSPTFPHERLSMSQLPTAARSYSSDIPSKTVSQERRPEAVSHVEVNSHLRRDLALERRAQEGQEDLDQKQSQAGEQSGGLTFSGMHDGEDVSELEKTAKGFSDNANSEGHLNKPDAIAPGFVPTYSKGGADSFVVANSESNPDELQPLLKPEAPSNETETASSDKFFGSESVRSRRVPITKAIAEEAKSPDESSGSAESWFARVWQGVVAWLSLIFASFLGKKRHA